MAIMGIRDHPTALRSPWQNGHVERLTGSIRRECLDHILVIGEASLRQALRAYAHYCNQVWKHRSLSKGNAVPLSSLELGYSLGRLRVRRDGEEHGRGTELGRKAIEDACKADDILLID